MCCLLISTFHTVLLIPHRSYALLHLLSFLFLHSPSYPIIFTHFLISHPRHILTLFLFSFCFAALSYLQLLHLSLSSSPSDSYYSSFHICNLFHPFFSGSFSSNTFSHTLAFPLSSSLFISLSSSLSISCVPIPLPFLPPSILPCSFFSPAPSPFLCTYSCPCLLSFSLSFSIHHLPLPVLPSSSLATCHPFHPASFS